MVEIQHNDLYIVIKPEQIEISPTNYYKKYYECCLSTALKIYPDYITNFLFINWMKLLLLFTSSFISFIRKTNKNTKQRDDILLNMRQLSIKV